MFFLSYLVTPPVAVVLLLGITGTIVFHEMAVPGHIFATGAQAAGYFVSLSATAIFSFVFAHRNRRHQDQLIRWATRDPLTGLYNRRTLDEELEVALAIHGRHGTSYGLIILDLDNFKTINDEWGHAAGDRVLVDLAQIIQSTTRQEDRAFRYGGDEFILLLPGVDLNSLKTVLAGLQQRILQQLQFQNTAVHASFGAALLREGESTESWNRRADRALYSAKEEGRNRAVIAEDEGEESPQQG